MKNIYMLPTDGDASRLSFYKKLELDDEYRLSDHFWIKNQQLYVTSNEEIKEGDLVLYEIDGCISFINVSSIHNNTFKDRFGYECSLEFCKKIVLTTDRKYIKVGIQDIDDEFLEWFVKNPTCEEVEVIRDSKQSTDSNGFLYIEWLDYKIIIPKTTQEIIDEDFAGGLTMGQIQTEVEPTSCACGANTSCQCEEPKEKTFEEILSKMTLVNPKHLRMTSNGHGEFPDGYMLTEDGVKYIVKQLKNK